MLSRSKWASTYRELKVGRRLVARPGEAHRDVGRDRRGRPFPRRPPPVLVGGWRPVEYAKLDTLHVLASEREPHADCHVISVGAQTHEGLGCDRGPALVARDERVT